MKTTKNFKHIIWQDLYFVEYSTLESWKNTFFREVEEEYPGYSDEEKEKLFDEYHDETLGDERLNLSLDLPGDILAIADLGFWDGRKPGYKVIGRSLSDCLYSSAGGSYCRWFVDKRGNLRSEEIHHDGTNYILYRMFKPSVSEKVRENLYAAIVSGQDVKAEISRLTVRLGDIIGDVYGWTFPGHRSQYAVAERSGYSV